MRLHPYALIIGTAIGISTLLALRQPIFAGFAAIIAIVLINRFINSRGRDDS